MQWHVAGIAKQSEHNWQLCKDVGLFGISTDNRKHRLDKVKAHDKVAIWQAGKGWIALIEATTDTRRPIDKLETPWGGGLARFGLVFPFLILIEPAAPIELKFIDYKQEKTGMSVFSLRKGFSLVSNEIGEKIEKVFSQYVL